MGIETKSLGVLIDELCTVSQKCFISQDKLMSSSDDHEIAKYAKQAQELNIKRNQLIRAIDAVSGNVTSSPTEKTYDKEK